MSEPTDDNHWSRPGLRPRPTIEWVWLAYLGCVTVVALVVDGGGMATHDPTMFVLAQLPVWVAVFVSLWLATRKSHDAARVLRSGLAVIGLPVVFSSLCWLLPAVHPEPYEFVWLEVDRWLFGTDISRLRVNPATDTREQRDRGGAEREAQGRQDLPQAPPAARADQVRRAPAGDQPLARCSAEARVATWVSYERCPPA